MLSSHNLNLNQLDLNAIHCEGPGIGETIEEHIVIKQKVQHDVFVESKQ